MPYEVEPLVPVRLSWAGAAIATGRTEIGLRTLCVPSDHVSEPKRNVFSGPSVRVIVSSYDCVPPAGMVKDVGVTPTVKPAGATTVALYVAAEPPTFVTVRRSVCTPARSPTDSEGWFRSLASIAGTAFPIRPWPFRKDR